MSVYEEKIEFFRKVIDDIIRGINYYNSLNIITINEYNNAQEALEKTVNLINTINYENIINDLQYINNNISVLIKNYGCFNFENIINICLSSSFAIKNFNDELLLKLQPHSFEVEVSKEFTELYNYSEKIKLIKMII
jgi:hypothetical protein